MKLTENTRNINSNDKRGRRTYYSNRQKTDTESKGLTETTSANVNDWMEENSISSEIAKKFPSSRNSHYKKTAMRKNAETEVVVETEKVENRVVNLEETNKEGKVQTTRSRVAPRTRENSYRKENYRNTIPRTSSSHNSRVNNRRINENENTYLKAESNVVESINVDNATTSVKETANIESGRKVNKTMDANEHLEISSMNIPNSRGTVVNSRRSKATSLLPAEMKAIVESRSKRPRNPARLKRDRLKIIPLGGIEEIGKNMTVFEFGEDIIVVDCGVAFPEDDMLGVDLVTPDITYLERNRERIRGIVITHGHEDHIGSIPYVLKSINVPIYATRLTIGLIQNKLEEHKMVRTTTLKCVRAGDIVPLGTNFKVEFIQSTHSIADSVALAIHTPVGIVIHTGDFKVDYTPIDGKVMDFARLAELGKQGVLALMSDSTNAEREGYSMSEKSVGSVFDKIFNGCDKRIIVATFASNVHRVQQVINSAVETNRKVAICGRSMLNVMTVAKELGYLDIPDGILIDVDDIDNYPPNRIVLITTGSQGETMAGLSRMAAGSHKKVTISRDDLVIISAHPIPGNEKLVSNVIDDLFKIGADVIYHALADVHVSGHACKEEQKLMLSLVKPKFFIPVHGEFRHLKAHGETAKSVGVPEENIVIMSNGSVVELDVNSCKITGSVPSGNVLIDGLGVGDVGNIVLRDRQHLSQDGVIIIVIAMDSKSGKILSGPDIISRGFVYVRESEDLMDEIKKVACREIEKFDQSGTKDWGIIKNALKDSLHDFLYVRTKRNPMLIPIITEV